MILSGIPDSERTIKSVRMLFDPDSRNYGYNSCKLWENLEAEPISAFYKKIIEKIPEINKSESKYREDQ